MELCADPFMDPIHNPPILPVDMHPAGDPVVTGSDWSCGQRVIQAKGLMRAVEGVFSLHGVFYVWERYKPGAGTQTMWVLPDRPVLYRHVRGHSPPSTKAPRTGFPLEQGGYELVTNRDGTSVFYLRREQRTGL